MIKYKESLVFISKKIKSNYYGFLLKNQKYYFQKNLKNFISIESSIAI